MGNRGGYVELIKRTLGFVATVCLAAGVLQAHHSLARVYDMKGEKELSGTLTSLKFTNPHGSLALAVGNRDGSSAEWVSAGRAQDCDHAGRARDPDLRR